GLTVSDPAANGSRVLSVSVTNSAGGSLGGTQVTLPDGGWWVLGLGSARPPAPPPIDPGPVDPGPPSGGGGGTDNPGTLPPPVPVPVPPSVPPPDTGAPSGPVSTPEPATLALVGVGLPLVGAARWLRW